MPATTPIVRRFLLDDDCTIVDKALLGGARLAPVGLDDQQAWSSLPQVKHLVVEVIARPAAWRALAIKDRHALKTEMDDEARRAMLPHLA